MKNEQRETGEESSLIGRVIPYLAAPFKEAYSHQQLDLFPIRVNTDEAVRLAYLYQQIHNPTYFFHC